MCLSHTPLPNRNTVPAPSPWGEGWGEGERVSFSQTPGKQDFVVFTRQAPR
jgi:hypothetical protein